MQTAYIVGGVRTPFGRYGGALAPVRTDDLAAHAIRAVMEIFWVLDPANLDEVVLGAVNQAGEDNRNVARQASLLAGVPVSVPGVTINRLCASGLEAVLYASRVIRCGDADLVIAGGVESMTRAPYVMSKPEAPWDRSPPTMHDSTIGWRFVNPRMAETFGVEAMPKTAQNVADEWGVSREDQDAFALRSQMRASAAIASGRLAREIAPVSVRQQRGDTRLVDRDEHPRSTSLVELAALRPLFPRGSVTAGNSSGVNDGAAALLIASEGAVEKYDLSPLARVTTGLSVGVEPRVMGIGPEPAAKALLQKAGLTINDIDVIELNEAFASQALAVIRELGLPDDADHVNPNGGAIALGHPLGASGARLALTAATELADRRANRALVTMCVGVGQGTAVLLESV